MVFLAVMLVAPPDVDAEGEPGLLSITASGSEVWAATLTVGRDGGRLGYGSTTSRPTIGALSSDVFTWRGTTYTVSNVLYQRAGGGERTWNLVVDVAPPLPDGFECLTLRLGDEWLNLSDGRGNRRQFFWYGVEMPWRNGARVDISLREFPGALEARAVDGWGNNRNRPELGTPDQRLLRRAGVSFGYAMTDEPPADLPNARLVSNMLSAQSGPMPGSAQVTDMLWAWGQFLDHDISFTPEAAPRERLPIVVLPGDPIFDPFNTGARSIALNRSAYDPSTGRAADSPRDQINEITAFIDASNVYGSDPARTRALRTNDGTGKLKTSPDGRFLPYNEDGLENDGGSARTDLFVAGDIRSNEQVGLTALHTLFVREHNRLAEMLAAEHPDLSGHEIFEITRKIVGAQVQVITYHEFLPLLLGPGVLGRYEGYDPSVDPSIATEFSTAAYRFGHTMLSPSLMRMDASGRMREFSLADAFFNPRLVQRAGISGLLLGLATQQAQEVDVLLVDEVRNMLFGAPGGPVRDLAALNIQRGRDHGLPSFNMVRGAYGLPPAPTFADVSSDPGVQGALHAAYGDIRLLDVWTGGLAEDHAPGAMLGETFRTIIAEQFRRLRDGDRYWHEHDPYFRANPALLTDVRATTLADVIRRNTRLDGELPASMFGGLSPAVTITADATTVDEGAPVTFTLTRSGALSAELPLDLAISESGAMLLGAAAPSRRATFGVGQDTITFVLETHDDTTLEHESTVSVSLPPAGAYRVAADGAQLRVAVRDDDGVEVALTAGFNLVVWPGRDGVGVAEALLSAGGDADVTDIVIAVYGWDEAAARWFVFVPGARGVPGRNTLETLHSGRSYLIRVDQPVTWMVPAPTTAAFATVAVPGN